MSLGQLQIHPAQAVLIYTGIGIGFRQPVFMLGDQLIAILAARIVAKHGAR